jgi:hypothetical protein
VLKRHLARLKLEDFDSIIILADESLETDMQTADSRSLATLLLLRQQVKNVQVSSLSLKWPIAAHSFLLCFGSALLLECACRRVHGAD